MIPVGIDNLAGRVYLCYAKGDLPKYRVEKKSKPKEICPRTELKRSRRLRIAKGDLETHFGVTTPMLL